jgi:hypothetical protein
MPPSCRRDERHREQDLRRLLRRASLLGLRREILLRYMVEEATDSADPAFSVEEIQNWRVVASLASNVGFYMCEDRTAQHLDAFVRVVERCSEKLRAVGELAGEDVLGWSVASSGVIWRGDPTDLRPTLPDRLARGGHSPYGQRGTRASGARPLVDVRF